jgi:putative endonuclease
MVYHVYILASATGVLYVGVTNNLERRIAQHKEKRLSGFTKRYSVTRLVYFEAYGDVRNAIAREKRLRPGGERKRLRLSVR